MYYTFRTHSDVITLEFYTFDTHPNVITLVNTRVLIFYTFETNPVIKLVKTQVLKLLILTLM